VRTGEIREELPDGGDFLLTTSKMLVSLLPYKIIYNI
jgi:hypothetical protein